MRTSLLLPLVTALALAPTIAHAAPDPVTVEVRIRHADLDLSTPEGFQKLEKRIKLLVTRACRNRAPMTGALVIDDVCVAETTGAALAIAKRGAPTQVAVGK